MPSLQSQPDSVGVRQDETITHGTVKIQVLEGMADTNEMVGHLAMEDINAMSSGALRDMNSIGLAEVLECDSRPTFVIDLDPDLDIVIDSRVLSPTFCNSSLRSHVRLKDIICGKEDVEALGVSEPTPYSEFRSWATSVTPFDDTKDIFPLSFHWGGLLWTGSTVRKRWRLVSGTLCYQLNGTAPPKGLPSKKVGDGGVVGSQPTSDRGEIVGGSPSSACSPAAIPETDAGQNLRKEGDYSTTIPSSVQQTLSSSNLDNSSSSRSSIDTSLMAATVPARTVNLGTYDWTIAKPGGVLTPHIRFARSIDWSSTALGAMDTWTPEFRQVANLVMANPHPVALFWGEDYTMMYNDAYKEVVAGRKHPALMGSGFQGAFSEMWDGLETIFSECRRTGRAVAMLDQYLPIERQGFLEETYFSWCFVPLYGGGKEILGFYNAPYETTKQQMSIRRTATLRKVGEEAALARTVKEFWGKVLGGLSSNRFDVPFALLYSVVDSDPDDGDTSSHSSSGASSISLKSCQYEGSLGIPEDHISAPARLDLKRSIEGFIPSFREAMRTREPTKLQTRDGTLPESLIEGIQWRGFGDPCTEAVIFPVRPTTGENILGFLLLGINPRRPYNEDYQSFVDMLNRQLATSLASIILFEEEIRRGRTAAEAAAIERQRLSEELEAQAGRIQRMAELSPVGMFYLDSDGLVLEANERWYEMTGYPKDSPNTISWTDSIHPDSLSVMEQGLPQMFSGSAWSGELKLKKPWVDPMTGDCLDYWILAASQPERSLDGAIKSVMGSITDISYMKWAEGLRNRRLEEAEETRRQQNNFIDITSHEMRNPLSAILQCTDDISSALEQIAKDPPDSTTITAIITDCIEAAETIALCAQHQKSIVDDILTISKLDSDLIQIIPTAVQPVDVVSRALKMFEAECRQKVIGIELNAADSFKELGIDWVVTDPSRLLQVLINLMTNAIKFTQSQAKRSIRVRLSVSLKPPSEGTHSFHYIPRKLPISVAEQEAGIGTAPEVVYLQFEVQDTGRGLTAAEMKLLFIRFSQASPRTHAEYGGSGLGLFISRQLTELLGGQIGVESEAGIGSTFAFYVRAERAEQKPGSKEAMEAIVEPMLRRETQVARSMSRRERVGPTHPIQPPLNSTTKRGKLNPKDLHVLIVEDNLVNQKVLSKQLNKLGCTVAVACHGGEALEYLETTEFWTGKEQTGNKLTIILMDLEMPVMDGLTAVQNIRDLEAKGTIRAKIPVIAVTANVRSEQIVAAKNSGMDGVVSKPFRIAELMLKIEELLVI